MNVVILLVLYLIVNATMTQDADTTGEDFVAVTEATNGLLEFLEDDKIIYNKLVDLVKSIGCEAIKKLYDIKRDARFNDDLFRKSVQIFKVLYQLFCSDKKKQDEYDHLDYSRPASSFKQHYHRMNDTLNITQEETEVKENNLNNLNAPAESPVDNNVPSSSGKLNNHV